MLLFVLLTVVAVLGWGHALTTVIFLAVIGVAVAVLAVWRLDLALLVVLGELFVGSSGHALVFSWHGVPLSLRLVLFGAVMFGWLVHAVRWPTKVVTEIKSLPRASWFLGAIILIGLLQAFANKFALAEIFSDLNNWLFWFLLLPAAAVVNNQVWRERAVKIFWAAIIFLGIKTLFYFLWWGGAAGAVHFPVVWLRVWYSWERDLFLSQITPLTGSLFRIFFWSNIYCTIGFFVFALWWLFGDREMQKYGWWGAAAAVVGVVAAGSRSFWVAGLVALIIIFFWLIGARLPLGFSKGERVGKLFVLVVVVLVAMISAGALLRPYRLAGTEKNLFSLTDAGVSNRWRQLPVLLAAIKQHPLAGWGFGKTLSYESADPRSLGPTTTTAFELGYLDNILKIGLVGTIALLVLCWQIMWPAMRDFTRVDLLSSTFTLGAVVILVTHGLTPYLHHPLGIGYFILVWQLNKKV